MGRRYYFGDIARAWGYVTQREVETALKLQQWERRQGTGSRFIGDILVGMGVLTDQQRNEILQAQSCGSLLERAGAAPL